jgi:hypothetical protein
VAVSPEAVKELRELTGAGMLDCKHALEEAGGDFEKAKEILRQKGHALAAKRAERTTAEGLVLSYLHHDGRLGSLVEINCESDFVARTEDFQQLAQSIALQVAATSPQYVAPEDVRKARKATPKICLPCSRCPRRIGSTGHGERSIRKTGENIRGTASHASNWGADRYGRRPNVLLGSAAKPSGDPPLRHRPRHARYNCRS